MCQTFRKIVWQQEGNRRPCRLIFKLYPEMVREILGMMRSVKKIFRVSTLALIMGAALLTGRLLLAADGGFPGETVRGEKQSLAPGDGLLVIALELPAGYDLLPDSPILVKVASQEKKVISLGEQSAVTFEKPPFPLRVPLKAKVGTTRLLVDLVLYYCKKEMGGLCLIKQARLIMPVTVDPASKNKELQVSYRLPAL